MPRSRDELDFCRRVIGWHTEPFLEVFVDALKSIQRSTLKDCKVLEIGASRQSAISLFFLLKGSRVDVTAHQTNEVDELAKLVDQETRTWSLDEAAWRVFPLDAHAITAKAEYDIIIMKAVLGGLDRAHNVSKLAGVLLRCSKALRHGGHLIVLDKGYASRLHDLLLRRYGGAGKHNWHYFTDGEIKSVLPPDGTVSVFWAGFLSLGILRNKCLQKIADFIDRVFLRRVFRNRGTVFAAVYTRVEGDAE